MARTGVNQRLIARELSLSPATVSKSFRNHPDIKPETRAMVLDYAARMGYSASLGKRVSRRKRKGDASQFIGVLFYDDGGLSEHDMAGRGFLTGLSEAAVLRNVNLIVHRFGPDDSQILDPLRQPNAMRDGLLQGLVLVHRIDPEKVRALATALPTVLLTHSVLNVRADLVDSDHVGGIARLMDRLHGFGHRRIGFVGRNRSMSWSQARFGSYCQSISRLGLELKTERLISVFDDIDDFDTQAEQALAAMKAGVTAFVCASDFVGYQLCRRLLDRGVRVPEDVSLTGFDAMSPLFNCPALTSLSVPFAEMGAAALTRLLSRIARALVPARQIMFECTLIDGETTAAAG